MTKSNILGWLSALGAAFATGATTCAVTQLEQAEPSSSAQWKAFGVGTVIGGAVAVAHLLQASPLTPKPPPVPELPEQRL